ncbi:MULTISPECIES: hypothetical protein [unclassified Pseudomonas]|uniref:hypothetical protein n=1 Tax=unclassified Pseudomonas TaxID=196821 RepID=UPI00111C131C|nr:MULTISPECIES: hypothetical protein [unclassified Pseudomonas]
MAILSISSQGCTQPGIITIKGVAAPNDPIYMCQQGVGNLIGQSFADCNGNFSVSGASGAGTWNVQLTTVAGGQGGWSTPLTVSVY